MSAAKRKRDEEENASNDGDLQCGQKLEDCLDEEGKEIGEDTQLYLDLLTKSQILPPSIFRKQGMDLQDNQQDPPSHTGARGASGKKDKGTPHGGGAQVDKEQGGGAHLDKEQGGAGQVDLCRAVGGDAEQRAGDRRSGRERGHGNHDGGGHRPGHRGRRLDPTHRDPRRAGLARGHSPRPVDRAGHDAGLHGHRNLQRRQRSGPDRFGHLGLLPQHYTAVMEMLKDNGWNIVRPWEKKETP